MKKACLLVILSTLIFGSSLFAQDNSSENTSVNYPIVSFNKAKTYIAQEKHKEARKILEPLVKRFPNDFEIRGLYFDVIYKLENHKIIILEGEKALETYKKIPLEERTEVFYENYRKAASGARQFPKIWRIADEWGKKFPKSLRGRSYRSKKALEEKDPTKGAKALEELIEESAGKSDLAIHYRNYFLLVLGASDQFGNQKVILWAGKLEKILFEYLNNKTNGKGDYVKQSTYFRGVLEIANKLQKKFPKESIKFAKKGASFFANFNAVQEMKSYEAAFKEVIFRTYLALKNWKHAQNNGLELIKQLASSAPNHRVDEAKLHRDYAISLEKLKQISLARKQFYLAQFLDKKYRTDWTRFGEQFPLSGDTSTPFKKSAKSEFKKFLASRESVLKANLLKTEIMNTASDFLLTDLNGKQVSLKDYKGKVLVLNFWATWCLPCEFELKELNIAYKKYAENSKVAFLIISTDLQKEKVPVAIKERKYDFPVFYVGKNTEKDYKIDAVPWLFIVDADGKIRFQTNAYVENSNHYRKELDWIG